MYLSRKRGSDGLSDFDRPDGQFSSKDPMPQEMADLFDAAGAQEPGITGKCLRRRRGPGCARIVIDDSTVFREVNL